jgi:hypothetical protein
VTVTHSGVPAERASDFASAVWQHVQDRPEDSLVGAPAIRGVLDRNADRDGEELMALLERVEALTPADRRLFAASIDEVQVRSKLWLIDELTRRRGLGGMTMVVLGAWYGVLPLLLNLRLGMASAPARMVCVDISLEAIKLGRRVISPLYPNIEYQVADAMELDYAGVASALSSVLVNTICEHLPDAKTWWQRVRPGQLTVLQSNNYNRCPDHVNCVDDLEQMKAQTPMSELVYEGTLRLPIFDRFMLIGYR